MKKLLITFMAFASIIACGQKRSIPENLVGVKETVAKLNSAVTSMYGWEPRDSTYNHSIDTLVANVMDQYEAEHPDEPKQERTEYAVQQQAYDEARITWSTFKGLIDTDKYEEALSVYLGDSKDHIKKNAGDFLVFLKHSTQRYVFYSQVLLPMMREYKGDTFAVDEYIDILYLEKAMEDGSIAMNAETSGYVPEVYPYVIQELGLALVAAGKMKEAQNLFNDLVSGVYGLTGDALFANFYGTQYGAQLYIQDGKPDWAIATWDNFKDYLNENKADYTEEELTEVFGKIQEEIDSIQGLK